MPADYETIRRENLARYGWDTAVLDLLGRLYSDRTHFIFELIQNAEDAGATAVTFTLFGDRLEVSHDGRPFTEDDVRGVCGVGQSEKTGDLTAIGRFGIGFKSVYAYTASPQVHSEGEHFRIESYVRPFPADPRPAGPDGTVFVFPFDLPQVPPAAAAAEIAAALRDLQPTTLLFLRSIERLRVAGPAATATELTRSPARPAAGRRRVVLTDVVRGRQEWLVWHRDVPAMPGRRVEIAFPLTGRDLRAAEDSRLVVFFPTDKQTFVGFLIQGPYRTTPARDNIPEQDPTNRALAAQTAVLLTEVLTGLRDDDLLTVDVLRALPIDTARFAEDTMLRPLYESVRSALASQPLVPVLNGGYGQAGEVILTREAGLRRLLRPAQLAALTGTGPPARFADAAITPDGTPLLWAYLTAEIGVAELTPSAAVAAMTPEFLAAQPDEWIAALYAMLDEHPSLWRDRQAVAARAPVIRLEDGRQVRPFDAGERPTAYLPGGTPTSLPTVRKAIAADPRARRFLEALGLSEPDIADEVLTLTLPRYDGLDVTAVDPDRHDADIETIAGALAGAAGNARHQLLSRLAGTAFLIGENAATGEQRLMAPGSLYHRSRQLELYLDGNPGAWFAADRYGPWRRQLTAMGVRDAPELSCRTADPLGFVVTVDEFARHERGTGGFDPAAQIDGLEFALRHPTAARSQYVWNALLVPNAHLVAGVVETSVRDGFVDADRHETRSALGHLAAGEAWLPAPDGSFCLPSQIRLDQLPPSFTADETLARALGLAQSVVEEAARQLGLSPELLRRLSERPDLVEQIERALAR